MEKIFFVTLFCLGFCLSLATTTFAMPLLYSAAGTIHDKQQQALPISGWVLFDDQLRDWTSGDPVSLIDPVSYQYWYSIAGYQLSVGGHTFSGMQGSLYLEYVAWPTPNDLWGPTEVMWFLEDGVGAWGQWTGEDFFFFDADGTANDHSQYDKLAPLIQLSQFCYMFDDPILPSYDPSFSLWLTRQTAAPVPEPSTLVLFGASLLGLLALRRKS